MVKEPPFADLIDRLASTNSFLDIAPQGRARQSSTSRWSLPDDAQRAVTPSVHTDFAFHTDFEPHPWWEIELRHAYPIGAVIVENRRNPRYQLVNNDIAISIFDTDGNETEIFHSVANFGALPDGMPLIVPANGAFHAKRIRITARGETYLHLARIRVFVDAASASAGGKTAIQAQRSDGLGQRLMALVNGLAVSELHPDFIFRYAWPLLDENTNAHHAIVPETEMFAPEFVKAFGAKSRLELAPITFFSDSLKESKTPIDEMRAHPVVTAQPEDIFRRIPELTSYLTPADLSRAYDRIAFAPEIEQARNAAREIKLPNRTVAIHLRAGDIVYGLFRFVDRFTGKAIPYPLAEELICNKQKEGADIIVFGQDADLCAYLRDTYGVQLATDLAPISPEHNTAAAIFDISLLSRCDQIYAGSSGFAQMACMLSGKQIGDPRGIFPRDQLADIVNARIDVIDPRVSHLQKAFACWYGAHIGAQAIRVEDQIRLVRQASEFDPANGLYLFVLASLTFAANDVTEGEAILSAAIGIGGRGRLLHVLTHKHPDGRMSATRYIQPILTAANSGASLARICAAVYEKVRNGNANYPISRADLEAYGLGVEWSKHLDPV